MKTEFSYIHFFCDETSLLRKNSINQAVVATACGFHRLCLIALQSLVGSEHQPWSNLVVTRFLMAAMIAALLVSCDVAPTPMASSQPQAAEAQAVAVEASTKNGTAGEQAPGVSIESTTSRLQLKALTQPWSGDLDGMAKRRVIRVLTVYGLGRYFLDGPQEKGIVYEMFKQFETGLNAKLQTGELKIHVLFIPVSRDELLPGLLNGLGDIAAAGLTITPERQALVDFSMPMSKEIREILVTGPSAPELASVEDLAGRTVHARPSSSYYQSLKDLSKRLQESGREPIDIQPISEILEDEDLLEMVQAGLLPWVVIDDYKTGIWTQVFDRLVVRNDLVLRQGGRVGFAFRKNSPQLAAALNEFLKENRQGTTVGNVLINRYLKQFDWVKNALDSEGMDRFSKVEGIFKKYGEEYGVDYLLVTAQGYQESQLDQSRRSKAGAVGIMQLLPSTAADPNVGVADIHDADSNIKAGVKYLDFIRNRYFDDPAIDRFNKTLMAFASYNAGPARIQKLRAEAVAQGLDPNVWFGNVEVVAAREIGRETVQYVANIYKYYISYRMIAEQQVARERERSKQQFD
jgi:membrane-bound lytic murein transglycosylase MltF